MFDMTHLLTVLTQVFKDKDYGESLNEYITARNPKSPGDVEFLEKQWQYRQFNHTGGGQWL